LASCSGAFLEVKPNSDIVIPTTLEDCRRLLDNDGWGEQGMNLKFPSLGQLASDEYYYDFATWQSTVFAHERNSYVWADDIYEGMQNVSDWDDAYHAIYVCNVVLDVLDGIGRTERNHETYEDIKGTALFFRAMWYHALTEVFCMPYDQATAEHALGLPLRTTPNIDEIAQRATLAETFRQIVDDLSQATDLLVAHTPSEYRNRPSKCAAHALLARIYLTMGDYASALSHATVSLNQYDRLLDYNTLELEGDNIFDRHNPEILVMAQMRGYASIGAGAFAPTSFVDSTLIKLYRPDDLRLKAFFTINEEGQANRKSLYTTSISSFNCFNGPAVDETILIKAECLVRSGDLLGAAQTLDLLLVKRIATGTFVPTVFASEHAALHAVLDERRKELLFRGMRWSDVRRLNTADAGIEMRRVLDGQSYVLAPNSPRYAFPIPDSEILFSHIKQNER